MRAGTEPPHPLLQLGRVESRVEALLQPSLRGRPLRREADELLWRRFGGDGGGGAEHEEDNERGGAGGAHGNLHGQTRRF